MGKRIRGNRGNTNATAAAAAAAAAAKKSHKEDEEEQSTVGMLCIPPFTALDEPVESFPLWALVAVPVLAAVIYLNSINGELFFDDEYAIERNADVVNPDQVPWTALFSHDYWGMEMSDFRSHKSFRPLVILTFRWNFLLTGRAPYGFHAGNILFHAIASFLVLPTARALFRGKAKPAIVCAFMFAAHPVHCEAVSGVVGRAEVMCLCFFLLAFLCGIRAARPFDTDWKFYVGVCVFAVCATLSKETGITVMGCLFFYDMFYVLNFLNATPHGFEGYLENGMEGRVSAFVKRQGALMAFSAAFMYWRVGLNEGVLPTWPEKDNEAAASDDIWLKVLNFPYIYFYNGWLMAFPRDLCGDYTFESIPTIRTIWDPRNILTFLFFAVIIGLAMYALLSLEPRIELLEGIFAGAIPFLPSSNIFFTVGFLVAERVLYIPSLGFCLILSYLFDDAETRMPDKKQVITGVAIVIIVLYSGRTVLRNEDWKTEESFWASALPIVPGNGKVAFNYGNVHFAKGEYEESIKYFKRSLEVTPDDPAIMINMATSYAKLNKFDEALEQYVAASKISTNLGQFYNWGAILEYQGKYEEAIEVFDMASKYNADGGRLALYQDDHAMKAVSAMHKGTLLCRLHRSDEGLEAFQYAVSIDPNLAEAWLRIGLELSVRDKTEEAIQALTRCLELDGSMYLALNELGMIYLKMGDEERGMAMYDESLRVHPDTATTNRLAMMYYNKNDAERAKKYYQMSLQINPEDSEALGALGVINLHSGALSESEEMFKRAISQQPMSPDPYFNYGVMLHQSGRLKEAIKMYKEAVRIYPQHDSAWSNMGAAYVDRGKFEKAVLALSKALDISPNKGDALANLALAYTKKGDLDNALEKYLETVRVSPTLPEPYYSIGSIYHDRGEIELAKQYYEKCLQYNPTHERALMNLNNLS